MPTVYPFDPTGLLQSNRIIDENQTIAPTVNAYNTLVPLAAPFFSESFSISLVDINGAVHPLVEGVDYYKTHHFVGASKAVGKAIYGSITLLNLSISGVGHLNYQTLGGAWAVDTAGINTILSDLLRNPRVTTWEQVINLPTVFPPTPHQWDLTDMVGEAELVASISQVATSIAARSVAQPPVTLPVQTINARTIGLGNVSNFPTANDTQAVGNSNTHFITPRGVKLSIAAELATYGQTRNAAYRSAYMPNGGSYVKGDYVSNTYPVKLQWLGFPVPVNYVIRGWVRMTDGNSHLVGVDWFEDRCISS